MPDYSLVAEHCNQINKHSRELLDVYVFARAIFNEDKAIEYQKGLSRFPRALNGIPGDISWAMQKQYLWHQGFRENGFIHKYIHDEELNRYPVEAQNYLGILINKPWRFSFSVMTGNPSEDFYEMTDVFSDETYLLHSPAITEKIQKEDILTWFNLVGYNGECWQAFGPVTGFRTFDVGDIYFFLSQFNPGIRSDKELMSVLDSNPIPYLLLTTGSRFPLIVRSGQELVLNITCCLLNGTPDMTEIRKHFKVEYADGVYKFSHKILSEKPHKAEAYWEEGCGKYYVAAETDDGYFKISGLLRAAGVEVPGDPDIRIHKPMKFIIEKILDHEVINNPYTTRFDKELTPKTIGIIEKLEAAYFMAIDDLDKGIEPDYENLGSWVDFDAEYVRSMISGSVLKVIKDE